MHFSFLRAIVVIAFLSLVYNTDSLGQNPYLLTDSSSTYRLDSQVMIFIDSTNKVSVDEVVTSRFQQHFHQSKGNLTFGYLKFPIWLKVQTKMISSGTHWYLEIPAPFLEYVDFYQLHKNQWRHSMAGYFRPQSAREISHTAHVLPLQFNEDSVSIVYIKITGLSPKTFPLLVIEKEKFNSQIRFEDLGYGVFFGILIVMFFYNLLLYITLQQINYLLYICTITCTFLIFAAVSGYGGKFLWPEYPFMNFYAGRMSLGAITIFLSVFTIRFLEVKRYSKIMYYILASLTPLAIIATILVVTKALSSAANTLIAISTVVYMITGIVCRLKGNKTASYFIAAWAFYLVGGLLLTLRNSGFFDFNFWTTHLVEIGAVLETTIIAFALGDRYRRYKREKEAAQLHALKIQLSATEKLEVKVKQRTDQLSKAYEDLSVTLETNTLQTKVIEDKNAELDAFFYRISHDLKGPIASLLGLSFLAKVEVKDAQAIVYIEKQHLQIMRLKNIITGLINLTKLNQDLKKEKIDFDKLIDECIAASTSLDNYDKITFKKEIEPNIEFYSEWTLLNAIFQNLIENSIKYARDQSPYVRIMVRDESGQIIIEVEDNGQGIPEEHKPKIFEMFFRATENSSGTGLGLYILKRSVERLKGNISIKSEEGVGSKFRVNLPCLE